VVSASCADTVICDGELSPAQLTALEKAVKVKVVDRTALILDIFAQHATSREGKAQVSLAQMEYMLPRLRGWGESMSRQAGGRAGGSGGGVGLRGPGETKIETDRRRIRERMSKLRRDIRDMKKIRDTQRSRRVDSDLPSIAIVGYTNAGKSSLLNALTGAGVLVQDALFATLEPTTRRGQFDDGRAFVISDTVGFVRHLPTQLVEAFRSTLEEVVDADLLVHVVDGSDLNPLAQISAVRQVISDVIADHVFAYILCFARHIPFYLRQQAKGKWEPRGGEESRLDNTTGPGLVSAIDRQHLHLAGGRFEIALLFLGQFGLQRLIDAEIRLIAELLEYRVFHHGLGEPGSVAPELLAGRTRN